MFYKPSGVLIAFHTVRPLRQLHIWPSLPEVSQDPGSDFWCPAVWVVVLVGSVWKRVAGMVLAPTFLNFPFSLPRYIHPFCWWLKSLDLFLNIPQLLGLSIQHFRLFLKKYTDNCILIHNNKSSLFRYFMVWQLGVILTASCFLTVFALYHSLG